MAQPSPMGPTVMNRTSEIPQGMIQSAQASPPDVTADGSKTSPGMLSDWYSSYMSKNPAASAAVTTPTKWGVTPDQTVQGQVGKVIDAGGPLMERAATRAATASAGRGLLNSTMGVQAGQAALYDVAVPIATADANINAQAGQFNANAANEADRFGATARNDMTKLAVGERGQDARLSREYDFRGGESAKLAASIAARDQIAIQADRATASRLADTQSRAASELAGVNTARDKFGVDAAAATATALAGTNAAAAATSASVLDNRAKTLADVNKAASLFSANVSLGLAETNRNNTALLNKSYNAVNAQSAYALALNSIAMSTLDQQGKDKAAENAGTVYKNALALISSVDNVSDLSSLVDFSGGKNGSQPQESQEPQKTIQPIYSNRGVRIVNP